jgi:hypothetical protein
MKINQWVVTVEASIKGTRVVTGRFETKEMAEEFIAVAYSDSDNAAIDYDPNREIQSAMEDRF